MDVDDFFIWLDENGLCGSVHAHRNNYDVEIRGTSQSIPVGETGSVIFIDYQHRDIYAAIDGAVTTYQIKHGKSYTG